MSHKMKKLLKGHMTQLTGEDIVDAVHHFPNMSEQTYNKLNRAFLKGKGCRICLKDEEMRGCGLIKEAKKVGKFVAKSGIGDVIVDEAVGVLPIPQTAKNLVSQGVKYEAKKILGGNVNPYLPRQITGAGLPGKQLKIYDDSSNLVRPDSDSFYPSVYNLPMYSTPVGNALLQHRKSGAGFKVNM